MFIFEKKLEAWSFICRQMRSVSYGAQINFGGRRDPHNSNGPPANCVNWAWKDEGLLISLFKRFVFYFFGEMVMSVIYNGSGDESDATLIFLGVK